jgi:periplasmic divalent cation tolerance protein
MSTEYCLVFCTCPDAETAARLAEGLVSGHRAACVNILPGLKSVYPWEGRIETAEEHLLLIKTATSGFERVEAFLKEQHPYELPEIIAVPMARGSTDYLEWVGAWLRSRSSQSI